MRWPWRVEQLNIRMTMEQNNQRGYLLYFVIALELSNFVMIQEKHGKMFYK